MSKKHTTFQLLASAPILNTPKPNDYLINGHEIVLVHSIQTSSPDLIMVKGRSGLRQVPLSACRKFVTPTVSRETFAVSTTAAA